jgi:hypothetical protein
MSARFDVNFGANLTINPWKNKRNKGFLPPIEEYQAYVEQHGVTVGFTNDGPLLLERKETTSKVRKRTCLFVEMEP